MKIFCFLLWHLIIIEIIGGQERENNLSRYSYDIKHDNISIKLKINHKIITINLIRDSGILANEHLPVWITNNIDDGLNKFSIMSEVGEFTTYHDYCTKTAVVHYHKWNRIDGVIDVNYYIDGLPFDDINKIQNINSKYIRRRGDKQLYNSIPLRQLNSNITEIVRNSNMTHYPELLIAISYGMHKEIEKYSEFPYGVKTVAHIITVYNAVDMMFRTVKSVEIKLNIAAIVIEGTKYKWGFEKKRKSGKYYIDTADINGKISGYMLNREDYFPRDSYDFIVYNTNKWLIDYSAGKLNGKSSSANLYYSFPPAIPFYKRNNVAVRYHKTYKYYPTIIRQLTYLITALYDDNDPESYFFDIKKCKNKFVNLFTDDKCSNSCLKWSNYAEEGFKNCLRKPRHCDFINYPRSLSSIKRKVILTADEQCQCYGYISHIRPGENIWDNHCDKSMYCRIKNPKRMATAPSPVDGTPCGINNVCWESKCVPLDNK